MKKFLMAIFAMVAAATVATAGVGIAWTTAYGAYDHNAADLTSGNNLLLDSYSAIWQLIYAGADGIADDPDQDLGGAGIADNYVTDDDVVWGERNIPLGGGAAGDAPYNTSWDNWMTLANSGSVTYEDLAWNTAGSVYMRVFEGTPGPETYYFTSSLLVLNTGYVGGGQPPQDFFPDTSLEGFQPTDQFPPVVPEPATMSLLGLGALVMAIRRRRS